MLFASTQEAARAPLGDRVTPSKHKDLNSSPALRNIIQIIKKHKNLHKKYGIVPRFV